MKKYILSLLLTVSAFAQTPIINLHNNNSRGVPVDSGKTVTVSGIVTASNHLGGSGPGAVQDTSGGISIYGTGVASLIIGDSVTVTGTLTHYSGLTQISGFTTTKHKLSDSVKPQIVTIAEIKAQVWNGLEALESRLVRLNKVTITSASTSFTGQTNYKVADSTGATLDLRLDGDVTSIVGTTIPKTPIDLIGILQQFDSSDPRSSGYQILPRFIQDIVQYDGKPDILKPILTDAVDTSSFYVVFNTARAGDAKIKYGLTTSLTDSVYSSEQSTVHRILLSNLLPSTQYFIQAVSANEFGTSQSEIYKFFTLTKDTSEGIQVYFNFPVDTTIKIYKNAQGNVDFKEKLINRISSAQHSIDFAVYSFDIDEIMQALLLAKNRGVKLRMVYDNRTIQNDVQQLQNAGVSIAVRSDNNGLMHNKFFVFDNRDSITTNDYVWTGSWNVTTTELNWKNNVVEIKSHPIASAYTLEFEEMFGSSSDTAKISNAKFGPNKSNNTPHSFKLAGNDVEIYFSPSDATEDEIVQEVSAASNAIFFSQFSFTSNSISNAIISRVQNNGVVLKGLIDNINDQGGEYLNLKSVGDVLDNTSPTMHHKYGIVWNSNNSIPGVVITGSHNWSAAANNSNDENTVIIHSSEIADQYVQEFKKRYNENGGTGLFNLPLSINETDIIADNYDLLQNYPNPFNPSTKILVKVNQSGNLDLSIYNMLGEKIANVYNDFIESGVKEFTFDGRNLSSGIYLYKSTLNGVSLVRKMMLVK